MFDYNYNHMLIVYGSHVRIWAPGMKYAMMIVLLLRFWGRHRLSLRYAAAPDRTLHLPYVWLHTAALRQGAAAQFLRSVAHRLCRRAVQRAAAHSMVPRARQYASSSSTCCRTVSTFGRASPVLPRS